MQVSPLIIGAVGSKHLKNPLVILLININDPALDLTKVGFGLSLKAIQAEKKTALKRKSLRENIGKIRI